MTESQERRLFHRIGFHRRAHLDIGPKQWEGRLIDLSLKGALLDLEMEIDLEEGSKGSLGFAMGDDGRELVMQVEISHFHGNIVGLHCTGIDVDSIMFLRRIIEMNTGDDQFLERELEALLID